MQLLVPTNWDPDLVTPLSKLGDRVQLYGVLPVSMVGSGGSGPAIDYMHTNQVEEYVERASSAGLTFDYLLNAPSMSNMEWDEDVHKGLLEHLEWVSSLKVDSVTVTIPYLMELIKRQFPRLKVRVSTIAHVDSVAKARFYESLGADSITLDFNINRDFRLIKAIRAAVKCELTMLVNNLCLFQCPYEYYHHDTLGHASQSYNFFNGRYIDYCVIRCTLDRLCDISQMIKARWVRPEDISVYEEMGINVFKISGRSMPTERILNAARAYSARMWKGNLYDILNVLAPKSISIYPELQESLCSLARSLPEVYIDNEALEGFLGFFEKQDCLSQCHRCKYCNKVAARVIRFSHEEVECYINLLRTVLDDLSRSRMVRGGAGARKSCT